ncbi:hypothetical protein F4777DRAFT_573584 [Nemania sp. FL0916]|nr:hypothetical protein F4777DRAFT_573584 [Nemania sp. FL0916]
MATASFSSDLAHYQHCRRDSASSNKSVSSRRPRLLRSYVTEPSITTENPCKGLFTSPTYSSRRAAELLNRVAVSSSNSTSPTSTSSQNSVLESEQLAETNHDSCPYYLPVDMIGNYGSTADHVPFKDSACYFSFPSFDTWDEERRLEEEKQSLATRP